MAEDTPKTAEVVDLTIITDGLDGAEEAPLPASQVPASGYSTATHGGGVIERTNDGLPDDCPIEPLGKSPGQCHYLDCNFQLMTLSARDHSRLGVMDLYGSKNYLLQKHYPRVGKNGEVVGWAPELAAQALMAAAARKGVWNPFEKVRGAGAWSGSDDKLIIHAGDVVYVGSDPQKPGLIGDHVYPASEAQPRPAIERAAGGENGEAAWLLTLLNTWAWRRPALDPMLLLGWISAAIVGGALKWRPAAWITGGQATGKSTLHSLLRGVFDGGIVSVSDVTAAAIWQKVGYATLPVAIDELEADDDNNKSKKVIALARQAASGGVVLRGGKDHKGAEFVTRSCFLFSSIIIPPLEIQDLSRLAILELGRLPDGPVLTLDHNKLADVGAALRRRLMDGWDRLPETLEIYRTALIGVGHSNRGADQFGTLLACADLAIHDHETDGKYAEKFAAMLEAGALNDWADQISDEKGMLQLLLTSSIDPDRSGTRRPIGEWIERAAGLGDTLDTEEGNRVLGIYGLKVEREFGEEGWLVIANQHQGLTGLFADSKWAGRSGRSGGWMQSARRIEGAQVPKNSQWLGGGMSRVTKIPLSAVLPKLIDNKEPAPQLEETGGNDDIPA